MKREDSGLLLIFFLILILVLLLLVSLGRCEGVPAGDIMMKILQRFGPEQDTTGLG